MNQRSSNNDRAGNRLDFVSLGTGGQIARHSSNGDIEIQVPNRATGESAKPSAGVAKASPNFKPVEPTEEVQSEDQKGKIIAANSIPVKGDQTK